MIKENYDIIVVAGQSNAEGNGLGTLNGRYYGKSKIDMLEDENKPKMIFDNNGILQIQPLSLSIVPFKEYRDKNGGILGSFPLSFASDYVKNNMLKEGRRVLIVNCAVGGTGFARFQWGHTAFLQNRMFDMIDYALKAGGNNKIVAFLWHQGEHDAFENTDLNLQTKKLYYFDKFRFLINKVREKYGENIPVIAGDFSYEWVNDGYDKQCESIRQATKKVIREIGGEYVKTADLQSNNQAIQNGDKIHFSRQSLFVLGKRYFKRYLKVKNR